MPIKAKPVILVYGNCQAEAVAAIFTAEPTIAERYETLYVPSFDYPTRGDAGVGVAQLANCHILFEQHDRTAFPHRDALSPAVRTIRFPSMDFNMMWPLACSNPFNYPEPSMWYGRFAYGDRVILGAINNGLSAQQVFEYYVSSWDEYKPDLRRLEHLERARIEMRDGHCNVKLGSVLTARFRSHRCLWTVNHPTAEMLAELATQLVAAAFPKDAKLRKIEFPIFITGHFSPRGPLGTVGVPVHPDVAAYLRLEWYDFNEKYRMADGTWATYDEYFYALIAASIEKKAADAAAAIAS